MSDGENSKRWLIDELMALRRSVSEIQGQLEDYVEEPSEQSSAKDHPPDGPPAGPGGLSEDERERQELYRSFFEQAPVALWCHDSSELKAYLHTLRDSGIVDLRGYFRDHPECLVQCVGKIRILEANAATLKLFKAKSEQALFLDFPMLFSERSYNSFAHYFFGVADAKISGQRQVVLHTLEGVEFFALLRWRVLPGYEESFARVMVAAIDLAAPGGK